MINLKTNNEANQYRAFSILVMLYLTIKLTTILMIYKVIPLFGHTISVSAFIMPLWFFLGDIISEVYGYQVAKRTIWGAIVCQIIFALVCAALSMLPAAPGWSDQALNQTLLKLPRVAISSSIAVFAGAFINAYAISRWRVLLKGKYFWLRSLSATAIGEFIFTIFSYIGEFLGVASTSIVFQLIMVSYITKLIINLLLVFPAALICYILKDIEGENAANSIKFNPFKLKSKD